MADIEKRTTKKGTVYRARIRMKGAPVQTATFDTKTRAQDWARKTEQKIKDGKFNSELKSKQHTVGQAIDRFIEYVLPLKKPMVQVNYKIQLEYWREQIGNKTLFDITPSALIEQRDKLTTKAGRKGQNFSKATINRYMGVLQSVLSVAYREWEWIEVNPFERIRKLPENNERVRYLTLDERERLLAACQDPQIENPYLYPAVIIALNCGSRKMEILTLKWENVDFKHKRMTLEETKNGERRGVPMVPEVYNQMEILYANRKSDIWVFPNRNGTGPFDITRSWHKAIEIVGIANFRFHDLRHTCASYLTMNKIPAVTIAELLGHKTLQMVKRYSHVDVDELRKIIEETNQNMFGDK
ncbi:site-specific integrase [Lachnospiraceae bacterium OttesenSCG-928-E19]|nr:site-specific integrase [Lachnospiraceae bacterium OttesenSCG-928-E19]